MESNVAICFLHAGFVRQNGLKKLKCKSYTLATQLNIFIIYSRYTADADSNFCSQYVGIYSRYFAFQVMDSTGSYSNTYYKWMNISTGHTCFMNNNISLFLSLSRCVYYLCFRIYFVTTGILIFTDVNYLVSDSYTLASMSPPRNLDPNIQNGTIITVQSPEN